MVFACIAQSFPQHDQILCRPLGGKKAICASQVQVDKLLSFFLLGSTTVTFHTWL